MEHSGLSFVFLAVAFLATLLLYPGILSVARKQNIVDNPGARKLQRVPVPVLGGLAVLFGMGIAGVAAYAVLQDWIIYKILLLLVLMLLLGLWDDVRDVSASLRFVLEILIVWAIIPIFGLRINDFHGLWGLYAVSDTVSIPLTIIAGVGIMNAVNMIDGVDGYCSTYGIMACSVFAVIFSLSGDTAWMVMAMITVGALIPFFFHNVFGEKSKMFFGDNGSLMLGTLLALFTFRVLCSDSPCSGLEGSGLSPVALTLATLAVPVFDTLKVMVFRMVRGVSPVHPDKTHFHHLFISMQLSHLFTSAIIVSINMLIIGLLLLGWKLGASIDLQFYLVVLLALLFTWGFYFFMDGERRKNGGEGSALFQRWSEIARKHNFTITRTWLLLRGIADSPLLGGK